MRAGIPHVVLPTALTDFVNGLLRQPSLHFNGPIRATNLFSARAYRNPIRKAPSAKRYAGKRQNVPIMASRNCHPIRVACAADRWERDRVLGHQGLHFALNTTGVARSRVYHRVPTELRN